MDLKSEQKLRMVHPDLVKVTKRALQLAPVPFIITCGPRTVAEQKILVAKGASKTMRSRHLPGKSNGLSHAVDIAFMINKELRWDWPLFHKAAAAFKQASRELKIPIEWGGDWTKFRDGPHFQLPWKDYP
jgi:peptidoglycan L-alanyl-D-glutamate endopeptidase CwlK